MEILNASYNGLDSGINLIWYLCAIFKSTRSFMPVLLPAKKMHPIFHFCWFSFLLTPHHHPVLLTQQR